MRPYVLKKIISKAGCILLCILLCALSFPVWAETTADTTADTTAAETTADTTSPEQPERVLHVATGGEGDGSDSAHPMGDLSAAVTLLSESGGSFPPPSLSPNCVYMRLCPFQGNFYFFQK